MMKLIAAIFCLLSISWTVQASLLPRDTTGTDIEILEQVLETPQIDDSTKYTIIKVSENLRFQLEATPNRDEMRKALGLKLPEAVKAQVLVSGGVIEEVDPLEAYEKLPPEQQRKFREIRMTFLINAARILNSTKFALGAGSLVGDAFSFAKTKIKQQFTKSPPLHVSDKKSFKDRSYQTVLSVLKGIDYKLWSQAPLVIDSNEFGLSLSVGIVGETGVSRKGFGGAEEVGFSLAFNKIQKAFVFELFHNSESFDNTKAAVSVLGVVAKAEMMLTRRSDTGTIKGSSFYPPAIPAHSAVSSDYFSAGFSSSLGVPPPPLADLLTFTNKFERRSWIRITVSPLVKGFVRLEFGDIPGSFKVIKMKFASAYQAIAEKVTGKGRRSCELVFAGH